MARVTQQKTRQALLVVGDPLDPNQLPEKLQLFNQEGEPLMLGGGYIREQKTDPSGVISPSNTEFRVLSAYPSIRMFKITTNRPARVRMYPTDEHRAADLNRPIGTRPHGDHGRLLEVVTEPGILTLHLSPAVDFTSETVDGVPASDFYVTLTNLDSVAGAVVTTYHYVRTE